MTEPNLVLTITEEAGAADTTFAALVRALDAAVTDSALHLSVSEAKRQRGDELGALAHMVAAHALEAQAQADAGALSDVGSVGEAGVYCSAAWHICQVATGYFMKEEYATALWWYRLVLLLEPDNAVALLNLVVIYLDAQRIAEAQICRERAYQIQRVFIDEAPSVVLPGQQKSVAARQLLILCVGRTAGNIPYETLLSGGINRRIKYVIDYAAESEDGHLLAYDLVFNAIVDPDVAVSLTARLAQFVNVCRVPLLNPPVMVARTGRDQLASLVAGLDDVFAAPCVLFDYVPEEQAELEQCLLSANIVFPVLVRPTETHGGQGLIHCPDMDALSDALQNRLSGFNGGRYLMRFYDYRHADGYYRKYRVVFIDRQPYPYHMAISSHWMVHYYSADMDTIDWKIKEEHDFLRNPAAVLGERAMTALRAVGQRINLDYVGIDFTLLPDGRVFIFEANATMLVHRVRGSGPLAHKNPYIEYIVQAFERMLVKALN